MSKTFTLTKYVFRSLTSRVGPLKCFHCGEDLKEGDKVVSKISGRRYHEECYLSLWR